MKVDGDTCGDMARVQSGTGLGVMRGLCAHRPGVGDVIFQAGGNGWRCCLLTYTGRGYIGLEWWGDQRG